MNSKPSDYTTSEAHPNVNAGAAEGPKVDHAGGDACMPRGPISFTSASVAKLLHLCTN